MKFIYTMLLAVVVLGSNLAQAERRPISEAEVLGLTAQLYKNIQFNFNSLPFQEKMKIADLVRQANAVASNTGSWHPIVPTCDSATDQQMQETFKSMKAFFYGSSGADMSDPDAIQAAQNWMARFACSSANKYKSDFAKIKAMAYSSSGLDMSADEARTFTFKVIESQCHAEANYMAEAHKHYNFAYSSSGLNMSGVQAKQYAKEKMVENFFSCPQY